MFLQKLTFVMEPLSAILITTSFSLFVIFGLFSYLFIKVPISKFHYRTVVLIIMSFLSLFLIYYFECDQYFHIFYSPKESFVLISATVVLFAGPIVQNYFYYKDNLKKTIINSIAEMKEYMFLRQTVIASFIEEMIYREFTCSVWENARISNAKIVFLSPVAFGLSHFSNMVFSECKSIIAKIMTCAFQCCYTIIFGWWESFVFLKTHCFAVLMIIHSFCNCIGFPDFKNAISWYNMKERIIICLSYVVGLLSFILIIINL